MFRVDHNFLERWLLVLPNGEAMFLPIHHMSKINATKHDSAERLSGYSKRTIMCKIYLPIAICLLVAFYGWATK
jgi:hypothetical protein